jgi:excisionase family DNA binding protein
MNRLLTTTEVAAVLRVSSRTVRNWIDNGVVRANRQLPAATEG